MKRFLALILLVVVASCTSKKEGNMLVNGTIKGLKKGTVYLQKMKDSTIVSVDSISLLGKDTFTLTDNIESPEMYYLTFDANTTEKRILFFGEEGIITINDNLDNFGVNPKIEGSKNQLVMNEYKKIMIQFQNKQLDLLQADFEAKKAKDIKKSDSLRKASESLLRRQYLYSTNFALTKTETDAAAYIALTDLVNANVKLLDTIYSSLSSDVKKSLYGKQLDTFIKDIKKNEQ